MAIAQPSRSTAPSILTLFVLAACGPAGMNLCLPSLPNIARHFEANYGLVQLIVTGYLLATAVLQLLIGPLSDRFGRRPLVLVCLFIFTVMSVASIFAPTIESLLVIRLFQSSAAGGMVLARAIVRDTVTSTDEAASRIGYVTMGMALMPMIGPIIGGFLDEAFGWESTFIFMAVFGLFAFTVAWVDVGETNLRRSSSMTQQFRSYPQLLRSPRFWGYSLTSGFGSGAFFAFLGGGPYVASEMLGLSPSEYGFNFAIISIGYMLGNFLSGRFSRSVGMDRMILSGNLLAVIGMGIGMALTFLGSISALTLFGAASAVAVGNGMSLPNSNAGMVSINPLLAGSASGLGGFLQVGAGAFMAFIAGAVIAGAATPMPLFVVMFISVCLALVANLVLARGAPAAD
ncbi:MAG: multidrug effflux MFS transporter [Rhizobiaceae bacterium]|nr:multidrug effflux MFS transporter [Rhizobiaceae bacterium]